MRGGSTTFTRIVGSSSARPSEDRPRNRPGAPREPFREHAGADHTNPSDRLLEAPGLVSGGRNFDLDAQATNLRVAASFDVPSAEVLFRNDRCKLVLVGRTEGSIGLIDQADEKLYYFIRFQTQMVARIGGTVTQVELWRSPFVNRLIPNVTQTVFFDVLLDRFGAVMSDTVQTNDGRRFWQAILARSERLGLTIRFLDQRTGVLDTYDPAQAGGLIQWLADCDPWGRTDAHEDKRLIVSR